MDSIEIILEAVRLHKKIVPLNYGFQFRLITSKNLDRSTIPRIHDILHFLEREYNVELVVSSGHYGCVTLQVNIVATSTDEALRIYNGILNDSKAQQTIATVFTILIIDKPYIRIDLVKGTIESNFYTGGINMENTINITNSQIEGENINIGSGSINLNAEAATAIKEAINKIEKEILVSAEVRKDEAIEIMSHLNEIKNEMASNKPDKSKIKKLFEYLGGISSIATIVGTVIPLLAII